MIGKEQKQKDVELLKRFICQSTIQGFTSNMWFNGLRGKYPYEYIQLMQKYRDQNRPPETLACDDERIKEAIELVNKKFKDLNQYLVHSPDSQNEIDDFNSKVNHLEDLLLKQNREN